MDQDEDEEVDKGREGVICLCGVRDSVHVDEKTKGIL